MKVAWPSLLVGGLVVTVIVALPVFASGYVLSEMSLAITYAIAILGLNLLMGYAGQICLAQGALFGVGAYATAILNTSYGLAPLLTLPLSASVAALLGLIVGLPALRLQGLQLAIITFGVAAAFPQVLVKLGALTGGVSGMPVDPLRVPSVVPLGVEAWAYFVCVLCAGIGAVVVSFVLRGNTGRATRAQRDNPVIAEALGVDLIRTRLAAFVISSALAGVGGGLFAILTGFVTPETFQAMLSVNIVIGSIVGGSRSIVGALAGALFVVYVPNWTGGMSIAIGNIVYGIALIMVMLLAPGGIAGVLHKLGSLSHSRQSLKTSS